MYKSAEKKMGGERNTFNKLHNLKYNEHDKSNKSILHEKSTFFFSPTTDAGLRNFFYADFLKYMIWFAYICDYIYENRQNSGFFATRC